MRISILMVSIVSVFAPVVFAQDKFDPAARAKVIAPFLDEQAMAVVHVDLRRVAVGPLVEQIAQLSPLDKKQVAEGEAGIGKALDSFLRAGGKDVYVLWTMPQGRPDDFVFAVVPLDAGADAKALVAGLPEFRWPGKRVGNCLLLAEHKEFLDRIAETTPDVREELAAAFEAAGDTAAQLLFIPPRHWRRVVEETLPELPKEAGGGSSKVVTQGVLWAAAGIDLPPQTALRLVVKSQDARAAEALRAKLVELMRLAGKIEEVRKHVPKYDEVAAVLTPTAEGDRLTLTLDEKNGGIAKAISVLTPPVDILRASAGRSQSANNLKQIALAMHNYYDVYKCLPPPASRSKDGKPLLSWRVHILPFVEQFELYKQFHLDEPWDSAHNLALIDKMPATYRLPVSKNREKGRTNYCVPVGNGAAFSADKPTVFPDIKDGTSNTIMVVEVTDEHAAVWTKPDDRPFDPKEPAKGLGRFFDEGLNTAFCDGSVRYIAHTIAPDVLRALFTRDGREVIPQPY